MNLDQLPYLLAVAAAGNPSAAARQLGVTQQAVSKYLNELENEIGLELFFRSKRQYLPTPAGHAYIQTARQILELRRHTRAVISSAGSPAQRKLRVGVSPNRGIAMMSEIYPPFERRYPQAELNVTEGYANELRRKLIDGELDAVISTHSGAIDQDLQMLPIQEEELVLAVPAFHPLAGHPAAQLEELPFAELKDFRNDIFIQPLPTSNQYQIVQALFRSAGFQPQVTATLPNIHLQMAMIRGGTRVGLLPAYYISHSQGISFFRLYAAPRFTLGYLTPAEHVYSEPERYLIWLITQSHVEDEAAILWGEELSAIRREFSPEGGMA
ncbi:MAG: LysR family transcriptional regulator [Clostridia bacterium]|nr:LysR family transcriptional regulator [Clostridia bacterium]